MNEDKGTRYHRLRRRASLLSLAMTGLILAGLATGGFSVAVRDWAIGRAGLLAPPLRDAASVALCVGCLALLLFAAGFPFSLYSGFLLERRYGLSTETARHWLGDHLKAGVLGLLFAELAGWFVYFTVRHWPDRWWVVAAGGYAVARAGLVLIGPVVLMPLFFRLKPLEREGLRGRLLDLARAARTPVIGAYEWRVGDRTKKANAALAGLGRTRRILVSDTLLEAYSDEEIGVILAHELAHHMHRDVWSGLACDALVMAAGFLAGHAALRWAGPAAGLLGPADPAGLPVLVLAAGGAGLLLSPAANAQSRAHERRADRTALRLTNDPDAFISAMRRLGQQNLAEERPSRLVQALFYTHPPIGERLRAARRWQAATAP